MRKKRQKRRPFGSVYRRPDSATWTVQFTWKRRRYRHSAPSEQEARKRLATVEGLLRGGKHPAEALVLVFGFGDVEEGPTLRALKPRFFARIEKKLSPRTVPKQVRRVEKILAEVSFAKTPIPEIQPADIAQYLDRRLRGGASVSTVNRDHAAISAMLRYAVELGVVERNVARAIPQHSEKGRNRRVWLTPDEYATVAGRAGDDLRPLLAFLIDTGVRPGREACAVEWTDLDLTTGGLHLPATKTKTGEPRSVTLTAETLDLLRRLRFRQGESGRVFPHDPRWYSGRFAILRDSLRGALPESKRRALSLYTLRHSFVTWCRQGGLTRSEVGTLVGHGSERTTALYDHHVGEHGAAAAEIIAATRKRVSAHG